MKSAEIQPVLPTTVSVQTKRRLFNQPAPLKRASSKDVVTVFSQTNSTPSLKSPIAVKKLTPMGLTSRGITPMGLTPIKAHEQTNKPTTPLESPNADAYKQSYSELLVEHGLSFDVPKPVQ